MYEQLVIFGATGDVAKRYVFPALAYVLAQGCLPADIPIIGVGRRDWTTAQFQEYLSEILGLYRPPLSRQAREQLLPLVHYARVDNLAEAGEIRQIFPGTIGPSLIYLGLPPSLFFPVVEGLSQVSLPPGTRIIIEKPFGLNLDEARKLNALLHRQFPEEAIFRIDHFLGMPIVSHILGLRFDINLSNRYGTVSILIKWK